MKINEITKGIRNTVSRTSYSKDSVSWSLHVVGTSLGHVYYLLVHSGGMGEKRDNKTQVSEYLCITNLICYGPVCLIHI